MDKLPSYTQATGQRSRKSRLFLFLSLCCVSISTLLLSLFGSNLTQESIQLPLHARQIVQKCQQLNAKPGPPSDFHSRTQSDRFEHGTRPTLLRNASIWTGNDVGKEVIRADILLDRGIIKFIGHARQSLVDGYEDLVSVDVSGSWVTPGIVDLHSHLGVGSAPSLKGSSDTNSRKGPILPWLRSLDGLNTHDEAYRLSISGGVTTANVLPGSANAIGGQAFVIKLRSTDERSPSSMLLEPPFTINGSVVDPTLPPRWRQMKQACGENPSRVYGATRMDNIWAFRQAYDTARKIKESQDNYCSKALAGQWRDLGDFPEDLQWEALVDVLRGRVKIHTHCYEAVDLDGLVRLSNEFQFPIAAFHHAHETYLVPDLLKQAYGHTPAAAIFATNARYKREAYRGSEFAARILADNGIDVVMKSDHPVLNSRYLLFEAQQAHFYGLPAHLALSAVTSTSARVMGQDHRIGFIREGYDADVVVWDSHPLSLGAAPKQVWIDGIPQLESPYVSEKPASVQKVPTTPNFDKETAAAVEYDGLPPLAPVRSKSGFVVFANISSVFARTGGEIQQVYSATDSSDGVVVVKDGILVCHGAHSSCLSDLAAAGDAEWIDLEGGSISPGLTTFGSPLGLEEIQGEASTQDGYVLDPLSQDIPDILAGHELIRAVDGLQFATRDALIAYRAGVTAAVVAPKSRGFLSGLSTVLATGAAHKLEKGAVIQDVAAIHIAIGHGGLSISTQIAALRRILLDSHGHAQFSALAKGGIPLVVEVQNADIIASLISLKKEFEQHTGGTLTLTLVGAAEAHLLAKEIGEAGIGVILTPARAFPGDWESKRILPGPPLTKDSAITTLLAHGVTVGVGIEEQWSARNTRFDVAWAALEGDGHITKSQAIALSSINLEKLLGVTSIGGDLVATHGGTLLDLEAKVVSVISSQRGLVDLL
ncbi:composite domain of metallo-dependent hydrolase [Hygrophoropsis aurantiaca]|uniref:Composite domain of metallo-dependent hydrolase n=1 Tax=Hygrophoropsis aurantiaca TaxID=72124 RepID=A0ACB8ADB5_9AGAM|nr:composite domain of metallo-dependent hydrolase [Hygrophoropsis aurantiaca]